MFAFSSVEKSVRGAVAGRVGGWGRPRAIAPVGWLAALCCLAALWWLAPAAAFGQQDAAAQLEAVKSQASAAAAAGHNAWMLTSAALVLFMTAPGLALFYSGLVRKKNVLGVIMQCLFLMAMMTVVWALVGYSLAFGGGELWTESSGLAFLNAYIGDTEFMLMRKVARSFDPESKTIVEPMTGAIPTSTHMLFQGMFFIITPALICGAFAERMKFSSMVVFSLLWGLLVYCPLCHWVWDGGILAFVPDGAQGHGWLGGALDFAGGAVVHISSGVSALVCALAIGKRLGHGSEPMPPHNLTYTAVGAAMLWVGWFGFNAGSQLASDHLAASAFMATHFAAAAGAMTWSLMEWVIRKKPSALGASSGAVAGLVCVTPAAGFVNPMEALLLGVVAGAACYLACTGLKNHFKYDDALDAFGVHGVGGTLGALLTGVFATRACSPINGANPLGLIDGATRLFMGQVVATVVTWIFAAVVTFILLKILDLTMGLRVSPEEEVQGLDISQHGEEGYIFM